MVKRIRSVIFFHRKYRVPMSGWSLGSMVRSIKSKGACLIVNGILSQLRGTLDFSFDSDLYKKYGQKDETNTPIPLGELDPAYLAELVGKLDLVSECEGWESITTFRFNGHHLSLQHIGLVLKALKALPRFRPTTIEIRGTSPDVVGQLKGQLDSSLYVSPPILVTNARLRGAVGGITRANSNNSINNASRRRRLPGVRAPPTTGAANAYRAAANALTRAAATGNTSGVSASIAAALEPGETLNLSTALSNPFKGKSESGAVAAPAKKGWLWGGRRKTRRSKHSRRRKQTRHK